MSHKKCTCECACGANEPTELQKKEKRVRARWLHWKKKLERNKDTSLIGSCKRFARAYDDNNSSGTRIEEKVKELEQEVGELHAKMRRRGLKLLDLP